MSKNTIKLSKWIDIDDGLGRYDADESKSKLVASIKKCKDNEFVTKSSKYVGNIDTMYIKNQDEFFGMSSCNFYYSDDLETLKILMDIKLNEFGYITNAIGM